MTTAQQWATEAIRKNQMPTMPHQSSEKFGEWQEAYRIAHEAYLLRDQRRSARQANRPRVRTMRDRITELVCAKYRVEMPLHGFMCHDAMAHVDYPVHEPHRGRCNRCGCTEQQMDRDNAMRLAAIEIAARLRRLRRPV